MLPRCECWGEHANPLDPTATCRAPGGGGGGAVCSGRGSCECGRCSCEAGSYGEWCQCDNTSCDRDMEGEDLQCAGGLSINTVVHE